MRRKGTRIISYTEVSTALSCEAKWSFRYGGHLLDGDTLKKRVLATRLSDGRAWGAGIAAWHASRFPDLAQRSALAAMWDALNNDADAMRRRDCQVDQADVIDAGHRLGAILRHHTQIADRLPNLTLLEGDFNGPVPSRSGRRGSNLYHFQSLIDGYTEIGPDGWDFAGQRLAPGRWIVEFKLRDRLHPAWLIPTLRQYRWYAWQFARSQGFDPTGIIVCERLNDSPHEPKILKSGKPSHDKRQRVAPEDYLKACANADVEPSQEAVDAFRAIRWHQTVPIQFTAEELTEAGRELTSAAALIGELDTGRRYPVRNASTMTCNGCDFKDICPAPADAEFLIDADFVRTVPKRLRGQEETPAPAAVSSPFAAAAASNEE